MKKYLIILIVLFAQKALYSQRLNQWVPKHKEYYRFKLINRWGLHIDTSLIKINGIYLYTNADSTKFSFERYFENGKYYQSGDYATLPDSCELEKLDYGYLSEYYVKDSQVFYDLFEGAYVRYSLRSISIENNIVVGGNIYKRKFWGKLKIEHAFHAHTPLFFVPIKLKSKPYW